MFHHVAEALDLAPALDSLGADAEEGGDLFVGALHGTELFKFGEIDLCLRARHASHTPLQHPQLRTPIRQRQAQALEVRMPRTDLSLDGRDLPAAAFDSCRHLP